VVAKNRIAVTREGGCWQGFRQSDLQGQGESAARKICGKKYEEERIQSQVENMGRLTN